MGMIDLKLSYIATFSQTLWSKFFYIFFKVVHDKGKEGLAVKGSSCHTAGKTGKWPQDVVPVIPGSQVPDIDTISQGLARCHTAGGPARWQFQDASPCLALHNTAQHHTTPPHPAYFLRTT